MRKETLFQKSNSLEETRSYIVKKLNGIIIGVFLCFIGGLACMHILTKDVSFSEYENRVLSPFPKFTLQRLVSGDFTTEFEVYLSDQFVHKEFWTGMKANAERAKLKQENNGVFWGEDGYLLEHFKKPGEQLAKNIASLRYFSVKTNGLSTYFMLVPTATDIYPEKLPLFAQTSSQQEVLEDVKQQIQGSMHFIDVYGSLLQAKNDEIYFHTDHHWTSRGAYVAYKRIAKEVGFKEYGEDDFAVQTVSNDFYGTHYAKVNDHSIKPDSIEIYKPKFDVSYHIEIEDSQYEADSLYEKSYLSKRDQYAFFLNGNHSKVKIKSSVRNGRKLLLVKDSYAHILVPFLANHFEEIHMIDLRYFHANIIHYIEQNEMDDVLFLYSTTTFTQDSNLVWLRQ